MNESNDAKVYRAVTCSHCHTPQVMIIRERREDGIAVINCRNCGTCIVQVDKNPHSDLVGMFAFLSDQISALAGIIYEREYEEDSERLRGEIESALGVDDTAVDGSKSENDAKIVRAWLADCVDVNVGDDCFQDFQTIYESYVEWAKKGEKDNILPAILFGEALGRLGFHKHKQRAERVGGSDLVVIGFCGLKLNAPRISDGNNTAVEDSPPYPENSLKSVQDKLAADITQFAREITRLSASVSDPPKGQFEFGVDVDDAGTSDYTPEPSPLFDDSEALDNILDEDGLPQVYEPLDPQIGRVVNQLRQFGIPTAHSCDGGEGHAFDMPTIRIKAPSDLGTPLDVMVYTYAIWDALDRLGYYGFTVAPRINDVGKLFYVDVVFYYTSENGAEIPQYTADIKLLHDTGAKDLRPPWWGCVALARHLVEAEAGAPPRDYKAMMPALKATFESFGSGYLDREKALNKYERHLYG